MCKGKYTAGKPENSQEHELKPACSIDKKQGNEGVFALTIGARESMRHKYHYTYVSYVYP